MNSKIIFISLLLSFLYSCQDVNCLDVPISNRDYINVKIVSLTGEGDFIRNGYDRFEVLEVNQSFSTAYNSYYDVYGSASFTSLKLPIAHNYPQTTFVFKGDTVAPETLMVNSYNARAELKDNCGYYLTIDEPQIAQFTFSVKSQAVFDSYNKILTFRIIK